MAKVRLIKANKAANNPPTSNADLTAAQNQLAVLNQQLTAFLGRQGQPGTPAWQNSFNALSQAIAKQQGIVNSLVLARRG